MRRCFTPTRRSLPPFQPSERCVLYRLAIGCESDLRGATCPKSQRNQSVYLSLRGLFFACYLYTKTGERPRLIVFSREQGTACLQDIEFSSHLSKSMTSLKMKLTLTWLRKAQHEKSSFMITTAFSRSLDSTNSFSTSGSSAHRQKRFRNYCTTV